MAAHGDYNMQTKKYPLQDRTNQFVFLFQHTIDCYDIKIVLPFRMPSALTRYYRHKYLKSRKWNFTHENRMFSDIVIILINLFSLQIEHYIFVCNFPIKYEILNVGNRISRPMAFCKVTQFR